MIHPPLARSCISFCGPLGSLDTLESGLNRLLYGRLVQCTLAIGHEEKKIDLMSDVAWGQRVKRDASNVGQQLRVA
jgi:hypothetical protein